MNDTTTCFKIVKKGHLHVLQWTKTNDYAWNEHVCNWTVIHHPRFPGWTSVYGNACTLDAIVSAMKDANCNFAYISSKYASRYE